MIHIRNKKTYKGEGEYIGRPSPLGNPFKMKDESEREEVVNKYRDWLWHEYLNDNEEVRDELYRLMDIAQKGDLNLICWCAPKACHGDVVRDCINWMIRKSKSFTLV